MPYVDAILAYLPEVKGPVKRKLSFKEKLKWTGIILVAFFILSILPLYGLGQNALQQFEYLSIILGASFGSVLSLGIGPIVTSSIVLQLLNGSGILKFDLTTHEGKKNFQGTQKLLTLFFIVFEASIYVLMGGLAPELALTGAAFKIMQFILIFQLCVGGILVMFMDEIAQKWGFGSGVSLFIAAGVSGSLVTRAFSPLTTTGAWAFGSGQAPVGKVLVFFTSLMQGRPLESMLALSSILTTILIFMIAVYAQSMKVEIPLSFGRIRGHGIRWPLKFIYTSNIPVILTAALMANVQLWARLLENWGHPLLGTFSGSSPSTGLVAWLYSPDIVRSLLTGSLSGIDIGHAAFYTFFMMAGSVLFSIFWVQTSGMDAASQARNMIKSGLQIPGFRRDERVLERLLNRYIWPLTIMGALVVGFLSASADFMGALVNGTSVLLTVMILYNLYESIAKEHMMDMNPMLRKMMGK